MNLSNYTLMGYAQANTPSCLQWCQAQVNTIQKVANTEGMYFLVAALVALIIYEWKEEILIKLEGGSYMKAFLNNLHLLGISFIVIYILWLYIP